MAATNRKAHRPNCGGAQNPANNAKQINSMPAIKAMRAGVHPSSRSGMETAKIKRKGLSVHRMNPLAPNNVRPNWLITLNRRLPHLHFHRAHVEWSRALRHGERLVEVAETARGSARRARIVGR
jgi:hypothetical protein